MAARGFILHPTYRLEGGRPVVHLFGRLESGESFQVRETRVTPYFFVRAADVEAARARGAARQSRTDLRTMRGEPVVRVEVAVPADAPPIRDALQNDGIPVYEADVRFAMRALIDGGLRGVVSIDGGAVAAEGADVFVDRVFVDPHLAPSDWRPAPETLRLLSIDLETDPRGREVYAAALAGCGVDEVLLALPGAKVAAGLRGAEAGTVVACGDEKGLLTTLFRRLRAIDFDILTGWNVIDFDLSVLVAAARRHGVPFEVGRLPGATRVMRDTSAWGRSRADIAGRVVLDGIDLLKSSFIRLEDYRLDTAARAILGEGKVALGGTGDGAAPGGGAHGGRAGGGAEAIERAFRDDLPRFVAYNRQDARLVLRILEAARLPDLAIRRSLLTGMPLDRVGASIASFDFLYLHELRKRGVVAPSVGSPPAAVEPTAGGAVLEPLPGLYDDVLAFDFKSLYPSLIRTFNIDPLGYVPAPRPEEKGALVEAPNGACFRREPGILPEILERLFPQREEALRRGDRIGAQAIKILMNSFYGVLATPACRFYSAPVANAITHFGQWLLHWTRDFVEAAGHRVLYGDTDSLFVRAAPPPAGEEEARRLGAALAERINDELRQRIRRDFGLESRLVLEFEALYRKFFIPSLRHGSAGARKRYAGLLAGPGGQEEIAFVGLEVVRRDWTELSKMFQRGLFERLFHAAGPEEVAEYARGFIDDLRAGRHDAHLVYRKAMRKGIDEYTATTPPHVKAARLIAGPVDRLVEYVMTVAGPEPVAARRSAIDYEHYVDKQLRPIAEQVLPHVGLSFDALLGGASQLKLF
jgi:DNA polymerase-2